MTNMAQMAGAPRIAALDAAFRIKPERFKGRRPMLLNDLS